MQVWIVFPEEKSGLICYIYMEAYINPVFQEVLTFAFLDLKLLLCIEVTHSKCMSNLKPILRYFSCPKSEF